MHPNHHDEWDRIVAEVRSYALRKYGQPAVGITIHLHYGESHREPFPPAHVGPAIGPRPWNAGPAPAHLSDFRQVYWPGRGTFTLSPKQALVVRALWKAFQRGEPEVEGATLLRAAESDGTRLDELFKRSPAWGSLVEQGRIKGKYRLPTEADEDEPRVEEDDVA